MNSAAKICAVVVTHNRRKLLSECLIGILSQTYPIDTLVIIDNASNDDTVDFLYSAGYINDIPKAGVSNKFLTKCKFKLKFKLIEIIYIRMTNNTGGAGGFYEGIKTSCELEHSYTWIMDDDAIPLENSLNAFLQAKKIVSKDFGYLAGNVFSEKRETMNVPEIDFSLNQCGYPDWSKYASDGLIKIKTATFVSIFLNNKVVYRLGLPIKEMFIWGDDTEFTKRIACFYPSYLVGNSEVLHKRVNAGTLSLLNEQDYNRVLLFKYLIKNNIYILIRYREFARLFKFTLSLSFLFFKILFGTSKYKSTKLSCIIKGFISGIFFKPKINYLS